MPGERVRKMEVKANEAFDVYRELYYEGGVSSVYLWNLDDGFAGVVLLKKCEFARSCMPPTGESSGKKPGGLGYKREAPLSLPRVSPPEAKTLASLVSPYRQPCLADRLTCLKSQHPHPGAAAPASGTRSTYLRLPSGDAPPATG